MHDCAKFVLVLEHDVVKNVNDGNWATPVRFAPEIGEEETQNGPQNLRNSRGRTNIVQLLSCTADFLQLKWETAQHYVQKRRTNGKNFEMALRAPASSLSQESMLKVAKAWADSAETIKAVISATCPAPFQSILTSVADILSFFARTYCDLVANREDAEKLARACESAGTSIGQLVARLPDFASDPSVSQLQKLLKEAYHYVRGTLTPPPRRKKQWITTLKSAASVKAVREKLNAYKDDIREQLNHVLLATSVSVRVAVADLPGDVWRAGELAMAEWYRRIVHEELALFEAMREQVRSQRSFPGVLPSAVADRKADKLSDVVLAAQHRKMLLQEEIVLGNMTLEHADAGKIYHAVEELCKEAESVAEQLKRPLKIEDWMVDANSVTYDAEDGLLGEGASGAVYHGQMDNANVAIKVFNIKGKSSREIEAAIRKEIKAWHRISDHKNIVSLLGVSTKVKHFIVSELCLHGTSRQYLGRLRDEGASWGLALVDVLCDAAEGIKFLHSEGLIHRDIKGANILVREDGSAALGDFGLSRVVGSLSTTTSAGMSTTMASSASTSSATPVSYFQGGTVNWSSPEQLQSSAHTLTTKSDTWSFGMTVFELLEDKEPFADSPNVWLAITADAPMIPTPVNVRAELTFLVPLISDCSKKRPTDRISDDTILDRLTSGMPLRKLLNESPRLVEFLANESDALLLRRVLELVVLQRDPLTPASMAGLLGAKREKIDGVLDVLRPALATDDHGLVQLKEPSLADYLTDPRRCTDPRFAVDKTSANLRIAALCLEVLSRDLRPNMCGFQNATEASRRMTDMSDNERDEIRSRIPAHVAYAARFWEAHVCSETATTVVQHAAWPDVHQRIESFATTSLVFWIEVLAAVGALETLRSAARGLASLLPTSNEPFELLSEAATLLEWFPELSSDSPACVYVTVMP
ncbi:hypothetical protein HK405_007618, partial [Cladochytrium tenue]